MDRTPTEPFEHVSLPEIDCQDFQLEFVAENQLDCSPEESDEQKDESIKGMEVTDVKTELTSEIDIEEHPIKSEPEEQLDCVPADDGSLKCDMCGLSCNCPEILTWHIDNCHGTNAIVKVVKSSDNKVNYKCWLCNTVFAGLEAIVPHLFGQHQVKNWPFRCHLCDVTFMAKLHFMQHVCWKKKRKGEELLITIECTNTKNPKAREIQKDFSVHMLDVVDERVSVEAINKTQFLPQCEHCGMSYKHREMLDWHIEFCHGPDPKITVLRFGQKISGFQCVLCKAKFNHFRYILQHLDNQHHFSKLPYECNICKSRQFTIKYNLMKHQLTCSKKNGGQQHTAIQVEDADTVECRDDVPQHNSIDDPVSEEANKRLYLACKHCGLRYKYREMLDWHIEFCHGPDAKITLLQFGQKITGFQCVLCKDIFKCFRLILQHLDNQHQLSKLPFECKICKSRQFTRKFNLTKHQLTCGKNNDGQQHTAIQVEDDDTVEYTDDLPQHNSSDGQQHTVIQAEDDDTVEYRDDLPQHNSSDDQQHTAIQVEDDDTVKCRDDFSQHNSNAAAPTHSSGKCVYCGLIFTQTLELHIQLCHGPDPKVKVIHSSNNSGKLGCVHCELMFTHREMLEWHIELCHGPDPKVKVLQIGYRVTGFQCLFCDVEINRFDLVIQHLRQQHHLSILPYHCEFCKCRQFTNKYNLMMHQLTCDKNSKPKVQRNHEFNDAQKTAMEISQLQYPTVNVECTDNSNEATISPYALNLHCIHCGLKYFYRETLQWHIQYCHGSDPKIRILQDGNKINGFQCVLCDAEIKRFSTIIQHLRQQHQFSSLPFPCNICKRRQFIKKFELLRHQTRCRKSRHNNGQQEIISEDHTVRVESVDLHSPEHRIKDVDQGRKFLDCQVLLRKLLQCEMCSCFYTNNKTELLAHIQGHLTPNTSGKMSKSRNRAAAKKKTFNHACAQCDRKYRRPEMMAWHAEHCHGRDAIVKIIKVKRNVYRYQCVFCKTMCRSLTMIIQHLRNNHRLSNLPFCCGCCGRHFILLTNLNTHRPKCNERKSFLCRTEDVKCKMCDSRFETKTKLGYHVSNFHATIKDLRHKCPHCDLSFNKATQLKSHCHKIHANILQCPVCQAVFTSQFFYKRHTKSAHCGAHNLKIRRFTKEALRCKFCGIQFQSKSYLVQHIRIFHRNALFHCEFCLFNTLSKHYLRSHIKNYHLQGLEPYIK